MYKTGSMGQVSGVHVQPMALEMSFLDVACRFADEPGTVLLMSGGDIDCARYCILGIYPWMTIKGWGTRIQVTDGDETTTLDSDPFEYIRSVRNAHRIATSDPTLPLSTGLLGYLAYDLKDCIEVLPRTSVDDLKLPHMCLYAASLLLILDRHTQHHWVCVPQWSQAPPDQTETILNRFHHRLNQPAPKRNGFQAGQFKAGFSKPEYESAILKIKDYIVAGDIYQVNMSQRFEAEFFGDPFTLFRTLFAMNPAPFFAYIHAGDHFVVSTSPERFLSLRGDRVETRPIKGTRPRGDTAERDQQMRTELIHSRKDDAELSMIVDLLRNDIGKVCQAGSVQVTSHKKLEVYENVYHLISIVEGTLARDKDCVDLIRAAFPGGSITGCPKIRSMEIIDELEPVRRHIYTGSIGYIGFDDAMDLSIAIRTATITNGKIYFSVGGGIVFDSNPTDEYEETLHKGRTLMHVFHGRHLNPEPPAKVWFDGKLVPETEARIPLASPGFQYGWGVFETLRVANGTIYHLPQHLQRFHDGWRSVLNQEPDDLTWDEIIYQVIHANGLSGTVAAVKLMAAKRGQGDKGHLHLAVTARAYTHRLHGKPDHEKGLRLTVYPHPRQSPLADHKSMNYLYYMMAGQWAKKQGYDEALILNPDGSVSETNSANILLIRDKEVLCPQSAHVLPGITQKMVCHILQQWGYHLTSRQVFPDELMAVDQVLLTNSLMGAVPVIELDHTPISGSSRLWQRIDAQLFPQKTPSAGDAQQAHWGVKD